MLSNTPCERWSLVGISPRLRKCCRALGRASLLPCICCPVAWDRTPPQAAVNNENVVGRQEPNPVTSRPRTRSGPMSPGPGETAGECRPNFQPTHPYPQGRPRAWPTASPAAVGDRPLSNLDPSASLGKPICCDPGHRCLHLKGGQGQPGDIPKTCGETTDTRAEIT